MLNTNRRRIQMALQGKRSGLLFISIVLLFFLFLIQGVKAENGRQLFSDSIHLSVEHRKYNRLENINQQRITDQYIEAFSKSIPRILAYTKFSIHWKQSIVVSEEGIIFHSKGVHIRGNRHYRGFPVDEYMTPEAIKCILQCDYKGQSLNFVDTLESASQFTAQLQVADSIKVKDLNFRSFSYQLLYTEKQEADFKALTNAIDQYYLDFPLLKKALEKVGRISMGSLNMLPIYNANLKEAENTLDKLQESDYLKLLDLEQHDPLQFLPRFRNLQSGIAFKRQKIDRQMKNLERLYYQEGKNYLNTDTAISRSYFEKSIQSNPYYSPAYLELARLDLSQKKLQASASKIEYILTDLKPDTLTYKQIMNFNDRLVAAFIDKAKELMADEDYNKATEVMEQAESFCENTSRYECSGDVEKYLSLARYGIYNAYISVARQALRRERPELALQYIRLVEEFQKKNSSSIISDEAIRELYAETAELLVSQAKYLLETKNFSKALSHFENAGKLCRTDDCQTMIHRYKAKAFQGIYDSLITDAQQIFDNDDIEEADKKLNAADIYRAKYSDFISKASTRDLLRKNIDQALYRQHLQRGYSFLNFERPEAALNKFTKAECLLKQYQFATNDTLDSLITVAAKPIVLSKIKRAELKVWGNQFSQARAILVDLQQDVQAYRLSEEAQVRERMQLLKEKLYNKYCKAVLDTFNHHKQQASLGISQTNYLIAKDHFQKALSIARRHPECKADTHEISQTLYEYEPLFVFAEMKQQLFRLDAGEKYTQAVQKAAEIASYYDKQDLKQQGLSRTSPLTYATEHQDIEVKRIATSWYLQNRNPEDALEVMRSINQNKVSSADFKQLQKKTGRMLARTDAARSSGADYRKMAENYSANQNWFRFLENAYRSEYRKAAGIFPYFF